MNKFLSPYDVPHWNGSRPAPEPVGGADWQSGITENSSELRPFLDGEPVPLAFAAKAGLDGWVECYVDEQDTRANPNSPRRYLARGIDGKTLTHRIPGSVVLLPCSE